LVIARGHRVYLTSAVAGGGEEKPVVDRSLRALCVSATDGKVIWDKEVFAQIAATAPNIHKKNSHASPTAIFENDRLFVHFGHQGTACLNAIDGSTVWSTRDFAYKPVHGAGGSPVIEGDLLIFNADAESDPAVIALDKASGKQRWKFARVSDAKRKFSFSTPLVIEVNGKRQLISAGSGVVNALDPVSGAEVWKARYDQGYSVVPRPVYAHGMVFIATGYDKPTVIAVRVAGTGDVTDTHVAWKLEKYAPHNPSMVVVGDELYLVADNGILSCLDAKTGAAHYQERCTGPISASILSADGKLYLQDEKGLGVVVKPGKTFTVLAKNDLAERSLASYGVVGADLLIRTEQHLWRVGMQK
jgi:outer membrane protein assembly factor BamB